MVRYPTRVRAHWMIGGLAAVALIAAACGGGDGDDEVPAASTAPAATEQEDAQAPAAAQEQQEEPQAQAAEQEAEAGATEPEAQDESEGQQAQTAAEPAGEDGAPSVSDGWRLQRVDRGTKPTIAIDADGTPLIAYMLERLAQQGGYLRVAAADGEGFVADEITDNYLYGPIDIAVSADGVAAVAYHDHDFEDASVAIRAADGGWSVSRIAHPGHDGWDDALAFDAGGGIHVLNIDPAQFGSTDGVEYARLVDGEWVVETVGSGPQPYEWGTDIAIDAAGVVHIVYFEAGGRDLVYGRNDGSGWELTPIYENGDAGRFAVIALGADEQPYVAFVQADGRLADEGPAPSDVVFGRFDGSGWSFEVVGRLEQHVLGFEGARRSVALAATEAGPLVAFIDTATVWLGRRGADGWDVERVADADGEPLQVVDLAVDGGGTPHLVFSTISGNRPLDGSVWYVQPAS